VTTVVPFTRYVTEADGMHGYSTFALRRANGSVAQLNWDRRPDESGQGPFTVVDSNGIVTTYTPQPGDLAFPVSLVQPVGGAPTGVPGSAALDPNLAWTVSDEVIAAGTPVYVELRLIDAGGIVVDTLAGTLIAGQP
jgi:hypothetical protein